MSSAWGIAGWVTDTNSATDFGDRTNDGNNLCRVTLVRNRDASIPLDQSTTQTAQGQQLLCLVADGVRFPSPGDRVYVGMPEDHWKMPGGSIVLATVTANPAATGNLGDGDQVIFADPRTGSKIVARGDGALVLAATKTGKPGGPMVYLQIGGLAQGGLPQSSLKFQSPHGTMAYDDYGFRINDAFQKFHSNGRHGDARYPRPAGELLHHHEQVHLGRRRGRESWVVRSRHLFPSRLGPRARGDAATYSSRRRDVHVCQDRDLMACFQLAGPQLPPIPGISIPLPGFGLPTLSLNLCCQFVLPLPGIQLPPLPIPPALIAVLNAFLQLLNALLSLLDLSFSCPFN